MADLIQISTPNPSQSYNNQNHSNRTQIQQNPTGQVFDLGNQTEIVKTNDRTGDNAQQNLKDDSGAVLMRSPADSIKNPSSALNTAKELIASETISLIRESGDTEALSKLMEFADEVMLSPETLVKDMAAQQKNSTIFGDKLWTVLKGLTDISQSKAFESAVADFAKASVDITSKDKILQSLSANFKYLAGEAAPSKAISDELLAASKALAGTDAQTNFNALKPTLLKLLGFTEKSILLNDSTKNLLPLIIHSMSRYNDNPDALKESFTSLVQQSENINLTQQELTNLGLDPQKSLADNLKTIFDRYIEHNSDIPSKIKQTSMFSTAAAGQEERLEASVNLLAAGAKHMAARISGDALTKTLSTIDYSQGASALRKALGSIIPNTPQMRTALQSIFDNLEETGDLDRMVGRLNTILENIDPNDNENVIKLAQGLNSALNEMTNSGEYTASRSTSMETLTDFLAKNIDNSFLHSLSGMNRGDMVQNMLTAPGVFTPLLHHFVPLDAFGIRAFGELWVDPNADELVENKKNSRSKDGGAGNHMFLCFDIENMGYFELEIYEKEKTMSVMLLCPEEMENSFTAIRETIPKIAEQNGYKVTAAIVEGLKEKRSLDKVFPKLSEARSGLNIKI